MSEQKTKIRNNLAIDYTARDFESIRARLIDHAKKYYPETYSDFSDLSFGSLLVDMMAYIGDQMSLYLDYSVNETFLPTANEYESVLKMGDQMGYRFDPIPGASGPVTLYISVLPDNTGQMPDLRYAPVLHPGTEFLSSSGNTFTLVNKVDFGNTGIVNYMVLDEDPSTGIPTLFGAEAFGTVISGRTISETIKITEFTPFLSIPLGQENVSEVVSVIDSEGREYYEVDFLAQNIIYRESTSGPSASTRTSASLEPIVVPRRFIVERSGTQSAIRFGYGSEQEKEAESILSPSDVILKRHARKYISSFSFDPYIMLKSDKLGVAPSNTELTITYRVNDATTVGVPAGSINIIGQKNITFNLSEYNLDSNRVSAVANSLEVNNDEPFGGSSIYPSLYELKHRVMSSYCAQNRAVTLEDYKAIIYNMPQKFGAIARCHAERDQDSFKNNINIYILSEDADGFLTESTESEKNNLKVWLSKYKTVMDTVDILDGKIVNLGIDYRVKIARGKNEAQVLSDCMTAIIREFGDVKFQMGQTIYKSRVFSALTKVPGVISVISVNIMQKSGSGYSTIFYSIPDHTLRDGTGIIAKKDVSFEIKYPQIDIRGAVEK